MVQEYLPKCLDSILQQTYRKIEVILVNDGSPDNCAEICEQYACQDQRVIVKHQENGGLSAARNAGVELAKGDYICFVDPDDYIHPRMYELLHKNLKEHRADISICGYSVVQENEGTTKLSFDVLDTGKESISVFNNRQTLLHLYTELQYITLGVWNKLYKKELFDGVRFKVGKIHEDDFIMHHLLDNASKVVYTSIPLYYYLQRNTSITGQKFNLKRLDRLEALQERIQYFKEKGYEDLYEKSYEHYLNLLFVDYYLIKNSCPEERQVYRNLRKQFIQLFESRGKVVLSTNRKIKYNLFKIHPVLSMMAEYIWKRIDNRMMLR